MIKCNATGRHCHVMSTALQFPLKRPYGILLTEDKNIVYAMRIPEGNSVEYVMPYCPWCGARLRSLNGGRRATQTA